MGQPSRTESVETVYPESDGQPMGETGPHGEALMLCVMTLQFHFKGQRDVYVGGNQFMYWMEGDPSQVLCPDVYVVPGRPNRPARRTWKVWEENGVVPAFILELTSASSRVTDLGAKRGTYELLGVREYAVFDPLGEYLTPRLQLLRLAPTGTYADVEPGEHGLWSEVLGLWVEAEGETVRFRLPDGAPVHRPREHVAAAVAHAAAETERADAQAARADAEATRARQAEEELQRLRARLERLEHD